MKWEKSDLQIGEELKLPDDLFVMGSKHLIRARYIGETEKGILAECEFVPSPLSEEINHYRIFINWSSIWCGAIKVSSGNCPIRARKKENK